MGFISLRGSILRNIVLFLKNFLIILIKVRFGSSRNFVLIEKADKEDEEAEREAIESF